MTGRKRSLAKVKLFGRCLGPTLVAVLWVGACSLSSLDYLKAGGARSDGGGMGGGVRDGSMAGSGGSNRDGVVADAVEARSTPADANAQGGNPGAGGTSTGTGGVGTAGTGGETGAAGGGTIGAGGRTGGGGGGMAGTGGRTGGSGGATTGTGGRTGGSGGASPGTGGRTGGTGGAAGATSSGKWSMGYYASWAASDYPIAEIEWSGLTHIAMAFYLPSSSGSLSLAGGDSKLATDLIAAAHASGVKAIASIGGADSQASFQSATSKSNVAAFAANLVSLMTTTGYDGIDIDWEPMDTDDEAAVIDIAKRIRQARPSALVTIPIGEINVNMASDLSGFAAIAAAYDQLNIMSYGQAGTWPGWKSWHSSALYHNDSATPTSIDSTVKLYLAAGVPTAKLGIGIGFYGLCYSAPVTGPDQDLDGATLLASDGAISYAHIMTNYYSTTARQWDTLARVPYLSFSSAHAPDGCTFISYDDEESIAEKAAYVKAKGLGGVIQWELNEGYLASAPAGQRNPLLKVVANTVLH